MTPDKIKEYIELLEKYIKESEALPFSASGIILSLHATTELLELLKSIRYVNIYQDNTTGNLVFGGNYHDTIESAKERWTLLTTTYPAIVNDLTYIRTIAILN